jgi:Fur family transcriptional regulator, iron response regulator
VFQQIETTDRAERSGRAAKREFMPTTAEELRHSATLRAHGLRPTRQRVAMMRLLFSGDDRHVSAEDMRAEADASGGRLPLATVYNSLRQFVEVGLLREVATIETRCIFDTRTDAHHHFLQSETGEMTDISNDGVAFARLPEPPEGMEIAGCEVTIRLRRKSRSA